MTVANFIKSKRISNSKYQKKICLNIFNKETRRLSTFKINLYNEMI